MSAYDPLADFHREQVAAEARERAALRDRFAAAALTGLLAGGAAGDDPEIAEQAFDLADSMMERRTT